MILAQDAIFPGRRPRCLSTPNCSRFSPVPTARPRSRWSTTAPASSADVPPRLPDQGRHPGDAHRRGHDRAVEQVPLDGTASEDSPRPPAPDWRRRLHHAAHPRAATPVSRRAICLPRRAAGRADLHGQPAPRRGDRRAAAPRPAASRRRRRARPPAAARAVRRRHRSSWRPRAAWLTWASGAPMRIGYDDRRAHLDVHARVRRSPRPVAAPLGGQPVGSARAARDRRLHAGRAIRSRWPRTPRRRARRDAARGGWHRRGRSARRRARERGQPVPALAAESFCSMVAALAERRSAPPHHRHVGAVGCRRGAARVTDAARARLASPSRAAAARSSGTCGELRALIARAAVYIGGDSGPLHVAARPATPIVALFGPTLPERSPPVAGSGGWRAETVDAGPLPCRPCDQRRCVPGDFRCLTRIGAGTGGWPRGSASLR